MNTATMKKITPYRGNRLARRVAIINAKTECALGKLGSRTSPEPVESFEVITKKRRGLWRWIKNLRL
jgi:hypothetical protein